MHCHLVLICVWKMQLQTIFLYSALFSFDPFHSSFHFNKIELSLIGEMKMYSSVCLWRRSMKKQEMAWAANDTIVLFFIFFFAKWHQKLKSRNRWKFGYKMKRTIFGNFLRARTHFSCSICVSYKWNTFSFYVYLLI